MVITRSPEGRDNDRSFSGPHIPVAGASTSGSVVPSVSQPEEQAKSAMGALNVTEAESVDESTDASMDTSSDGGSTVRELNRQLESTDEDDDGNGVVSDTGSAHHDHDNSEWEHQRRRPKRSHHDSDSKSVSNKKSRFDTNLAVFIKGTNFDISKEANKQPIEFSRRLGSTIGKVREVRLATNGCVKVTCLSVKQKNLTLKLTDWFGKAVTVTEPWSKSRVSERSGILLRRGIIFGVSDELTEYQVATEVKAQGARRMVKRNGSGNIVKTGNMIITFQDEVPEHVYIGCLRYRVRPYIPQPMRCMKCQGFGHTATHCKRHARCVRCGQGHSVEYCPVKDDLAQAVCVNCKGHHSAAFKGCSKYQEVSKALKVSVQNKVSYRDALMQVKSGVLQRAGDESEIGRPLETSTPATVDVPVTTTRPAPSNSSSLPASRRQLFQSASQGVQSTEPAQRHQATAVQPEPTEWKPQISAVNYLRQFTSHFLYTLSILDGSKPTDDFALVRRNLNDLACRIFGKHGSTPCLSPVCNKPKD